MAKVVIALVIAALGTAGAMYADADDAPGGILLGFLFVIGAAVFAARTLEKPREDSASPGGGRRTTESR